MFRKYTRKQQFFFPLNLKNFISEKPEKFFPEKHTARVLNDIIDVVDINAIESTHSKERCPAYHPGYLLKILLYDTL